MELRGTRWLLIGLFLALAISQGSAQILIPRVTLDFRAGTGGVPGVGFDPSMVTATAGSLTDSFAIPFSTGSASADYGELSIDLSSSGTGDNSSFGEITVGAADYMTINATGSGFLRLNFDFSGDFSVSGAAGTEEAKIQYLAQVILFQNALFLGAHMPSGVLRHMQGTETASDEFLVSDFSTALLAVDFNDPVEFHMSLSAVTSFYGGANALPSDSHEAIAENLTLSLASIEIFDAGGQPLSDTLVTRGSGIGKIIPEPSRAVLILISALALAGALRYRCPA